MHLAVSLIALFNWRAGLLGTLLSPSQNKNKPCHTHHQSIHCQKKDKIQGTLIKQSLVILRILCAANVCLMFNTIVNKKKE